jgi:hypothetical protein
MMFDPKCYELAEYFLSGEPRNSSPALDELAQIIQDAIEDYLIVPTEEYPDPRAYPLADNH